MYQNIYHYVCYVCMHFNPKHQWEVYNIKKNTLCLRIIFTDNFVRASKSRGPSLIGQLRMLYKLYLKAQWHTNGYSNPHIVIITIWLCTFSSPHTHFRVLNPRHGPRGQRGRSSHSSSVITQLPLELSKICRPQAQLGHVWILTCILALKQKFPLWA